jgi:hypothetical protein
MVGDGVTAAPEYFLERKQGASVLLLFDARHDLLHQGPDHDRHEHLGLPTQARVRAQGVFEAEDRLQVLDIRVLEAAAEDGDLLPSSSR